MTQLRVLLACEMSGRVRHEFFKRNWDAWSCDILPDESEEYGSGKRVKTVRPGETPRYRGRYYKRRAAGVGIERHYEGDVLDLWDWDHPVNAERKAAAQISDVSLPLWDLIIAFPPCTHLSYAGNRWRAEKRADGREDEGAAFFMKFTEAPAPFIAIENPRGVMFSRYRKPDQEVQPYFFGDPFRKTTCFWLEGAFKLPQLVRTDECKPEATAVSGDMAGYRLGSVVTQGSNYAGRFGAGANHYEDSHGRKNRSKVRSLTFPGLASQMAAQWGEYVKERNLGW
jgi:hypothetical protein